MTAIQEYAAMKRLLTLALIFGLSMAASADAPPITLGGMFNLTGSQAALDVPTSKGAQLAVDQANQGDVIGRKVNLVVTDCASDLQGLAMRTKELLATHPRLSALLGFSDTDFVLASAPISAKQKLPFVTSGATSPRLPKEVPNHLFLACFGDNVQAAAGAEFVYGDLKARTAFVLYDDSTEYTRLLQQYFVTRFQELGGKVIGSQSFTPTDVQPVSLKAAKADVIFLSAGPREAVIGVNRLRNLHLNMPILGGDSFDSNAWPDDRKMKNVYYTTHVFLGDGNTRPAAVKFRQDYTARYPDSKPDAFAALGYDTVNLVLSAIRSANSGDPQKLDQALGKMENFEGVTGTFSFAGGSHIPKKSVSVVKVEKGRATLVREVVPQSVPAP